MHAGFDHFIIFKHPGRQHRWLITANQDLHRMLNIHLEIHGVRDEMDVEHPMQILIRCDQPAMLAARMFENNEVVEARMHDDRHGLFIKTRNPDGFYLRLNEVVALGEIEVESVAPVDDDMSAVYEYLIGSE